MSLSSPFRILHIDTGMGLRGGQRQLLLLAEGLRQRGHEQMVACLEGSDLDPAARKQKLATFALPALDPLHAFGIMLLRQRIEAWRPQIVHAHDGRGQSIAWFASVGLPLKRVASRRVTFLPAAGWTYRLKYRRTCDAVVAVSEQIRELSIQAGIPVQQIHVIPDGIDIPAQVPTPADRAKLRAAWGLTESDFAVGLLGASTPEKGHDVAIAAIQRLTARLPRVKLVHAVDDDSSPPWRIPSAASFIRHFTGLNHLADFFPGIDLFIMPSKSEGLGSSALWAMAYGLPVVATQVGGLPEIVTANKTGWLIPPNSPEELAEAIFRASQDRNLVVEYGRNGRTRAEDFSTEIMVNRTEALYKQLTMSVER